MNVVSTSAPTQDKRQKHPASDPARSGSAASAPQRYTHPALELQQTIGNRALQRWLETNARRPAEASSDAPHDSARANTIQNELSVGAPGDAHEREAHRVAEQVMRAPASPRQTGRAQELLQTQHTESSDLGQTGVPPVVNETLRAPGQPLDPAARDLMESRFGYDFGAVRVHADERAARSAEAVSARAYTVGRDVVFGPGRYEPSSLEGQRLLAHELAHVVQQSASAPRVQRAPEPTPNPGVQFQFSVEIDEVLDSDQLLLEFIKQYRNVETDAEAVTIRDKENWRWKDTPTTVTEEDVKNGFVLLPVLDHTITPGTEKEKKERGQYFKSLGKEEQAAINSAVNQEFWDKTHYRPGEKLGKSAKDRQMAEYWKVLRDEMIRKRQALDALPPDIRAFIFDEEAPTTLAPEDYGRALDIAAKVMALTPAELAEYKSRVTAQTTDWSVYEASLDRFIAERMEREATAQERREIETRLFDTKDLYRRYLDYVAWRDWGEPFTMAAMGGPEMGNAGLGTTLMSEQLRTSLDADLVTAGFTGGIPEFEKFIEDYEQVFEQETLALARVMLDQYEHVLWEEEKIFQHPAAAAQLFLNVSQSGAKRHYREAEEQRMSAGMSVPTAGAGPMPPHAKTQFARAAETRQQAESEVVSAAAGHPLVQNRDFDRESLAKASGTGEVRAMMLDYIAARKQDIAETRKNLEDKPKMIYGLNDLLEASIKAQNIQSGTVYDDIIREHIKDEKWSEAIPTFILTAIAVAAGLLTAGGGTVAVLGAGTVLGIGAYQAVEEFRRYEMQSAAYGAQLTSDDPTMAWVIIAVIGAGFDAAAFGLALSHLRPALQAFNAGAEAGDVGALTSKLNRLHEVDAGIRQSILDAAAAEAQARAAWKAVFRPPAALRAVIVPGAEEFGRFVYAVYLSVKRGIREFQVFVKTREAVDLVGDVAKLSPEELALLKTAFLKAVDELETVAAHGKQLGLADAEISAFMNLRSQSKGMTIETLVKEMDAWKATRQGGLPTRPVGKTTLIVDENVTIALEKQAAGVKPQPGEQAMLERLKDADLSDLRVSGIVHTKGKATEVEQFNITVSRESAEYKEVLAELDKFAVGRKKGVEDRQIVADAFFAKTEPGVKPVLATHDKGVYNRLALMAEKDPAKLGKPVAEALKDGFEVNVKGHIIIVKPLPGG